MQRSGGGAGDRRDDAALFAGSLFVGGGLATLVVALIGVRWPIDGFDIVGIGAAGSAAIAAGVVVVLARRRVSWALLHAAVVSGVLLVTFTQLAFSTARSFGPMLLLWPVLWGYTFLDRRGAHALTALAALALTVVLAVQDGWQTPAAYWLFVAGTIVATAATIVPLVERYERAVRSERQARAELAELNRTLEQRVDEQVAEIGRLGRLRRFLSPQVADVVLSDVGQDRLAPHRREIAVLFCDLRSFTSFAAVAEPEEVTDVLTSYHEVLGELVVRHGATVGAFSGDGVMLYFGDPVPSADPAGDAVALALELAEPLGARFEPWRRRGFPLGYGVGIALGYATLGMTGFESRRDYTAIGTVVNLASRLCDDAAPGEVLVDARAAAALGPRFDLGEMRRLHLKGFAQPVAAYPLGVPARSGTGPAGTSTSAPAEV